MERPSPLRPVVRLKPKANLRAIKRGAPWIFDNELVLDRRTKGLAPGTLAQLEDNTRTPLGVIGVTPTSRIAGRMLDRDPNATLDEAWFATRILRALALRETLYSAPFYRLIHAEADGLPGVIVDRFDDVLVLQPNAAWAEALLDPLVAALTAVTGARTVLKNASSRGRALEGLDAYDAVLQGSNVDAPKQVAMNGAIYFADLTQGQKTGLFFDQRDNQAFAARLARGASVLDVFSHVGGFGLAALAHGARACLAVDSSEAALGLAEQGAQAMGCEARFNTRRGDGFDVLAALGAEEASFDLVICDPPAFAPNKQALDNGLRAYERVARLAAPLVAKDGHLVLCSCSHAADLASFTGACLRGIGRAGRRAQLIRTGGAGPDHPLLPQLAESGYLKALFFRL